MQIPVGVRNNLWAKQQGGLYTPKRMNFPVDNLELYLPLGYPELSGSPIISKDLNAHSCTVVGAVHVPPTHRTFDGDDKITLTSPLSAGDTFTAIVWYMQVTYQDTRIFMVNIEDGAGKQGIGIGINAPDANQLRVVYDGVAWGDGTTTPTPSTWYMATMVRVAGVSNLYLNDGAGVISTIDNTPQDSGTEIHIGKGTNPIGADYFLKGIMGEVWIYRNRAFTLLERQRIFYATRWRYR